MGAGADVITYTQAGMEDIPVIFHQCKALIDSYEDVSNIHYEKVLQWVWQKIEDNISQYTKLLCQGETVGYYRLHIQDGEAELDDFYILAPYRGLGIGTTVLNRCIAETKVPVFLYVFQKNLGAIRFYSRFGFEPVENVGKTRAILRRSG